MSTVRAAGFRPPISTTTVTLPVELRTRLDAFALARGRPRSYVIQAAVELLLERESLTPPPRAAPRKK